MTSINWKKILYILIGVLVAVFFIFFILPVSLPILLALLTAIILAPAVRVFQEKIKLNRKISVFFVFSLFLFAISITSFYATTQLTTQVNSLVDNMPRMINEANYAWMNFQDDVEERFPELPEGFFEDIDQHVTDWFIDVRDDFENSDIIGTVTSFIVSIPSYIISLLVYLIALYLFLLDMPRLKTKLFSYMKEKTAENVRFMVSRMSFVILGFLKAQFLVSLIILAVTLIGLYIIAPEVALVMSVIIWLIDFIPIIGSIAILAPWAIYHLVTDDIALGVQLLVLAGILLTIRRTVEPKIMGNQIGLSPLATLISLFIGMQLIGVLGFILGPLLVILFTSAREAGIIKVNLKI
ncbi:sporulation integral membrane protein YtvI [Texcoconibacillus texcoconensis]|uniref:Sporulation integral membrane protein YtvI n=1 Tax=Texcoconibacillus texcoconensis TaxID=1095777 RepID=A0A840QLH0_9BACI|nr:sporulation integral membrane protein YtvI [Texcoconibacillus texcoconensis]MBB5172208.1 sporulation integral membrane protein YtvI [Texcoconibacillus texcoconensis]